MIFRLDPPIPVEGQFGPEWSRTGPGYAYAWLDYSQDHDLLWLVLESSTREWWIVPNQKIRGEKNQSLRGEGSPPPFSLGPGGSFFCTKCNSMVSQ